MLTLSLVAFLKSLKWFVTILLFPKKRSSNFYFIFFAFSPIIKGDKLYPDTDRKIIILGMLNKVFFFPDALFYNLQSSSLNADFLVLW